MLSRTKKSKHVQKLPDDSLNKLDNGKKINFMSNIS